MLHDVRFWEAMSHRDCVTLLGGTQVGRRRHRGGVASDRAGSRSLAFEAGYADPVNRTRWSVVVTGIAVPSAHATVGCDVLPYGTDSPHSR